MERGLYEQLITVGLQSRLATIDPDEARTRPVDTRRSTPRACPSRRGSRAAGTGRYWRPGATARHRERTLEHARRDQRLGDRPASQLLAVRRPAGPGAAAFEDVRPATPLSEAALLTNTRGEPNLGSELRAELDSCDEVDLLCAFVKWYGLRLLDSELSRLKESKGAFPGDHDDLHGSH